MQCRKLPHLRHSQVGVVGGEGDRVVDRVLHVLELHRAFKSIFSISPLIMNIMIFILYTLNFNAKKMDIIVSCDIHLNYYHPCFPSS